MAGLILTLVCHFLNLLLLARWNIPHFGLAYGLVYGPCILFVVKAHAEEVRLHSLWHFMPAIALVLWILIIDMQRDETPATELGFLRIMVLGHLLTYLLAATRISKKLKTLIFQTRSKAIDGKMSVLQGTIGVMAIVYIIALLEIYINPAHSDAFYSAMLVVVSGFVLLGMLAFIYMGLENPFIFDAITADEKLLDVEVQKQYATSNLTREDGEAYLQILQEVMQSVKPYKNDTISITELARITNIPPRYLSQIINQYVGKSFFDFVNSYRVAEAKIQLQDPEIRISEVMYDIGFSSRSSFNMAFKKITGQTPSQYRQGI